jgi:hypothetical protein
MLRLSGKNIQVPAQNVHVHVSVGNVVTFTYSRSPLMVTICRIRYDIDWQFYIRLNKSM